MKRIISLCLLIISLSVISFARERSSIQMDDDMSETIQTFYRSYVINKADTPKVDSLLTLYCTVELKNVVMEALNDDDYDFVLNGCGGCVIDETTVFVTKQSPKYKVTFKIPKYPVSSGLATVTVYVKVNTQGRISSIIRPSDNYVVP